MILLVMTDGRLDCLRQAVASADHYLDGVSERVIHDDTGDERYRDELRGEFPGFKVIGGEDRLGFGGAIANAWNFLVEQDYDDFVFHLEDDFVFNERPWVNLHKEVLYAEPSIVQIAMKRQAWNIEEIRAGGIVELDPGSFTETTTWDYLPHSSYGEKLTEHRKFFTTNPSLYRLSMCKRGWPTEDHSEGVFTHSLLADPLNRFAYSGGKFDPPTVSHIGKQRKGVGY